MNVTVGLAGSGADRIISGTAEDEINRALADVGAAGGGTVSVLAGTYSISSAVWMTHDNVTLKGAGAGQTVLRAIPGYPVGTTPFILATGIDDFNIQDITVDGHTNDIRDNGIMTLQCTNGTISGCEVLLSEGHNYGIWLVLSDQIDVLDNHVDGTNKAEGQEGIETWSSDNVLISGNTVENIGGAAINLGSIPTGDTGDIYGHTTNIRVINNTADNADSGTSIGLAGPRSFGNIEIQGNTFTNMIYGVKAYLVDGMTGAPPVEYASLDHPQFLHDVDISNNRISLATSSYGYGVFLWNTSSPGIATFSNINAYNNIIDAPADALAADDFDNFTLDGNILLTGTAQRLGGSPYDDIVRGSRLANVLSGRGGADVLSGGGGADTFMFDLTSLTPSQPGSGIVDRILDYNQGNSGIFNAAEGDTFDFSALLSAGSGQPVDSLVRVLATPSGTGAILQIDQDGAANGARWTIIAQLDGVGTGKGVNVVFDASQPAATLTVSAMWYGAAAADFNGDGKADILWQNDNGRPAIWTMDGNKVTSYASLPDVGPTWHVEAAADFNGDGKADILWQNDSGLPAIWTMNGATPTAYAYLPDIGSAWHFGAAADFNGDGKADILWQNDNGRPAIWTMDANKVTSYASLPAVGPTWHVAAAADFNGDGKADILWQNDSGQAAIWTMNGSTPIAYASLSDVGPTWHVAAAADFNGDRKADILWQNDSGRTAIWTMNGSTPIAYASLSDVGPTWHATSAADFNGDSKADILWRNDSGVPAIWTMNGSNVVAYVTLPDVGSDWHLV